MRVPGGADPETEDRPEVGLEGDIAWQRVGTMVLSLASLIAVWQVVLSTGLVSEFVLPAPAAVSSSMIEYRGPIASATLVTLYEIVLGFGAAIVLGLFLAVGLTYSRFFNAAVYPPVLILHAIPKVAIAPLLLIWFGFGLAPKIVLSLTLAFFPILIASIAGFRSVDAELHELARTLKASWFQTLLKIDFPHALPSIFAGLRTGIHLAVVGAVIAEFVSGGEGLAFLLHSASSQFQTDLAFAVAIVISVLSAALFGLVVLVERLAIPWARR
jgi:NitT/TauT family transport system permease protein